MMRRLISIGFLFIAACVDPLNVKLTDSTKRIVVDGLITNLPGPYQVKMFYSNKLSVNHLTPFTPVTSAVVKIMDDLGNQYNLIEISPGLYETDGNEFTGQIGRSYYVLILLQDGKEYRSEIQEMKEPGAIDNVYFEFDPNALTENGDKIDALKVYLDSRGGLSEDNLFRWRWTTIHKAVSRPELKITSTPGGDRPTPEPCSGYIYRGGRLIRVGDCTCCICWSYNYNDGSFVSKNEFVSESLFKKQFIGLIPITAMHFYENYYIEVQQLSLSGEAYHFWNLIEKQQKGSSDLFQPDAIKISGNIKNTNDESEKVLGFFGVSAVASKSLYIQPYEVPYPIPDIDIVPYSCLDYFKNPTTEQPIFW